MKLTTIINSAMLLFSLTSFAGCKGDSNISTRYREYIDTNKNGKYDCLVTGTKNVNIFKGYTKKVEMISSSDTTKLKRELSKEEILIISPAEYDEKIFFN